MRSHTKIKVEKMAVILEPALGFQKSCSRSDKAWVGGFFPRIEMPWGFYSLAFK